jgi:hypothetical protein
MSDGVADANPDTPAPINAIADHIHPYDHDLLSFIMSLQPFKVLVFARSSFDQASVL